MTLTLYHTGYEIIREPQINYGRSNADFGPGFYLSDDEEFSKRWARIRDGKDTYINKYMLHTDDLNIKTFSRELDWFDYIYTNRSGRKDLYPDHDMIIGPIANDTVYDTYGILTSGLLDRQKALDVLLIGPEYKQIVIKSQKAINALEFLDAVKLTEAEIMSYRETVEREEADFQEKFGEILNE
ncbi:MAG: DUF3990 domain-containing protein [Clostridiales bacterium]|nr:DUF3990 domain-containing protein [Clostridiales bacterium]